MEKRVAGKVVKVTLTAAAYERFEAQAKRDGTTVGALTRLSLEDASLRAAPWMPLAPQCKSVHGAQQCEKSAGHRGTHQESNEAWTHA